MHRSIHVILATILAALVVGGPFAYRWYQIQHYRNFRIVRTDVLYRSGQLSPRGLDRVCREHGIRTVITLREAHVPGTPHPDAAEEAWCRKMDIMYYRLPPKCWSAPDGSVPADENVRRFLEIMDDPKHHPVLIHCFAGEHRTGAYCCVFRIEYDCWSNADALAELRRCGYENLDDEEDVRHYLSNYQRRSDRHGSEEPRSANRE